MTLTPARSVAKRIQVTITGAGMRGGFEPHNGFRNFGRSETKLKRQADLYERVLKDLESLFRRGGVPTGL